MNNSQQEKERFRRMLDYWIKHNREHISELELWQDRMEKQGWPAGAGRLKQAVGLSRKIDEYLEIARKELSLPESGKTESYSPQEENHASDFTLKSIGTIHTPYRSFAPYQPRPSDPGDFIIEVKPDYEAALSRLEEFRYIYVLYYLHRGDDSYSLKVQSPWSVEEVGLFASRSSHRPNPLGLSVVKLITRNQNKLFTSGLDVFDGTPLLDLKPYLQELDAKADADFGWLSGPEGQDHLLAHIRGIPH